MTRTIQAIVSALLYLHPGMPKEQATRYATVLRDEAKVRRFDPLTYVALAEHESNWRASAISPDGEDLGLAAIRARHIGACKNDPEPVTNPGAGCKQVRASLLNGEYNLRLMASGLSQWRELCQKRTGHSSAAASLSGYAGLSRPPSKYCGLVFRQRHWHQLPVHKSVKEVLQLRQRLLTHLQGRSSRSRSRRLR